MKLLKFSVLVAFLFSDYFLFSQKMKPLLADSIPKEKAFDDYIEYYNGALVVTPYMQYETRTLAILSGKKRIAYRPNTDVKFGIGLNYNWIGFNATLVSVNNETGKFGDTNTLELGSKLFIGRKTIIDFQLEKHTGYYATVYNNLDLENTTDKNKIKKILIREDIVSKMIEGSVLYSFNGKKFSYKSSFNQTERQKRSVGSFILGFFSKWTKIVADYPLIPNKDNELTRINFNYASIDISATIGYGYNFIFFDNWYLTFIGNVGVNNQINIEPNNTNYLGLFADTYLALGYNKRNFQLGLNVYQNITLTNQEKFATGNRLESFKLFFTYRFDTSKSKFFKKVDNMMYLKFP